MELLLLLLLGFFCVCVFFSENVAQALTKLKVAHIRDSWCVFELMGGVFSIWKIVQIDTNVDIPWTYFEKANENIGFENIL